MRLSKVGMKTLEEEEPAGNQLFLNLLMQLKTVQHKIILSSQICQVVSSPQVNSRGRGRYKVLQHVDSTNMSFNSECYRLESS